MGIMGPNDHLLRSPTGLPQVIYQFIQGFCHVLIPEVPGGNPTAKHIAVVFFGIGHQAGVLLGIEVLVFGNAAIPFGIVGDALLQVEQLADRFVFAGFRQV